MLLSEFELINTIVRDQDYFNKYSLTGPGDDCGVFNQNLLITSDTIIEQSHFDLNYSTFFDVGWKSIAVSLSDIAAMGGKPLVCTVALTVKEGISEEEIQEIYKGIYSISDQHNLQIIGGDTTKSKLLSITTTVVGQSINSPILRSSAKAGDVICLSNKIGLAQLGLEAFIEKQNNEYQIFHTRPNPRLELSTFLAHNKLANSMIDVSDGLFQDLMHVCQSSKLSAKLFSNQIPSEVGFLEDKKKFLQLCSSGDDYELLFSCTEQEYQKITKDNQVYKIGYFEQANNQSEIYLDKSNLKELLAEYRINSLGFKHF